MGKITSPESCQYWHKININAVENRLTGVCLITAKFALVVVEGCQKSQERYSKLMLRRIKWEMKSTECVYPNDSVKITQCELVWNGLRQGRNFERFKTWKNLSSIQAYKILRSHGVEYYWDLVSK